MWVIETGIVRSKMSAQPDHILRLVETRDHDPFGLLGLHPAGAQWRLRAWHPGASEVALLGPRGARTMTRLHPAGLFELKLRTQPARPWRLSVDGATVDDPYAHLPTATAEALYLFAEGRNYQSHELLGAHPELSAGVAGVRFRVWAPAAARVSVVGEWNDWDGRRHLMQNLGVSGVWELFIPGVLAGQRYKFELRASRNGDVLLRADPYARASELRPATASRIPGPPVWRWQDGDWLERRAACDWRHAPLNVYELHAGSWLRHPDGRFYDWYELAARLVPYVVEQGYTHIELLPVTEHPLDESWGYQSTGFFAPSARQGASDGLRALIDACHCAGIGVLLDWVPGHFPADDGALAHFDGTPLYEHDDPRLQRHPDWGTSSFNYGRREVVSFLLSSACYWLEAFHFDGLRVDAVASMLYLDYSRKPGEWTPNRHGGREHLEAIDFLRALNTLVSTRFPGALTIAEESTAWPGVTHPVQDGGLGFSFKWNMGWMNDSLKYFRLDPIHRSHHHALLTFGQLYAYSEHFLLPLSHDEVVHGKGSLLGKMPGDDWQRYAQLRLLFAWQLTSPGKKLNFMGNEFGQRREWSERHELDWFEESSPAPAGIRALQRDLNRLYRDCPALHELDHDPQGFTWIDCNDAAQSTLSYLRRAQNGECVTVVLNFTPVPRPGFRLGVPAPGRYTVLLNTDSHHYGGSDVGEAEAYAHREGLHGQPASLSLTLPPLGAVVLRQC